MSEKRLFCSDFPGGSCCNSCHEDADECGIELSEWDDVDFPDHIPEGSVASLCCHMASYLDDLPAPPVSEGGETQP